METLGGGREELLKRILPYPKVFPFSNGASPLNRVLRTHPNGLDRITPRWKQPVPTTKRVGLSTRPESKDPYRFAEYFVRYTHSWCPG
jgi:hypothetical protein